MININKIIHDNCKYVIFGNVNLVLAAAIASD